MAATSTRVERIVSLVAELTTEERAELAQQIEELERSGDPGKRARVAEAIRRVVKDHPTVLAALAK
jgi:DNA-binding transcriptional MerR regulator